MLKVVVVGVVIAIITVGVLVVSSERKVDAPTPTPAPASVSPNNESPAPASPGQYVDYSDGIVAATTGQKILFFHAPWCPQCRQLDAQIKSGPLPDGVTIIKTDYDSMQSLRQKYGVTLQTTFVKVDDQGELIKKYVAYDEPTLAALKENIL